MADHEDISRYQQLAAKWASGAISPEERAEFTTWFEQNQDSPLVVPAEVAGSEAELKGRMLVNIQTATTRKVRVFPIRRVWAAAAVVLLLIGSGLWLRSRKVSIEGKITIVQQDALPGSNRAILTLSNGSHILLDSTANGTVASQGTTKVLKTGNGRLTYQASQQPTGQSAVLYNTLSTPRGGQYQLTLPDNSHIWLNAASSITYPTVFSGMDRVVTISGEAYLEVAKDARHPFVVRVMLDGNNPKDKPTLEDIRVLGTAFNINAYGDESAAQTTLVEGVVQVKANGAEQLLRPGEQTAVVPGGRGIAFNRQADMAQVLAWRNGLFSFDSAGLPEVLRQLSRWYDVDIEYQGAVPVRDFEGKMQRNLRLSQVLHILEKNQVHFRIDQKKIIVMP